MSKPVKKVVVKKDKEPIKATESKAKISKTTTKTTTGHKTIQSDSRLSPTKKHETIQSEVPKAIDEVKAIEDEIEENNNEMPEKEEEEKKHDIVNSMPVIKSNYDSNKPPKKTTEDKTDQSHQITTLKKDNDDLKKKMTIIEKEKDDLIKNANESQKKCQEFLKEMNEMSAKSKKSLKECESLQVTNDELKKKIALLEEDIEILNEELGTKDLELQVFAKNHDEYRASVEQVGQNNQSMAKAQPMYQSIVSAPTYTKEQINKLQELEEVVGELSQNLVKVTEERDYAIKYYKDQIEQLNTKMSTNKELIEKLPQKDALIKLLTDKLKDYEEIVEVLQTQITALSPANNMYEQIIIEKDDLDLRVQELLSENQKLKHENLEDQDVIREQDTLYKLSEKVVQKQQNDLIQLGNEKKELESKLKEAEEKEKNYSAKIAELNQINKIIKEELSKVKDVNINIDDMLNTNLSTNSKLKMYERQRVLLTLESVDNQSNALIKRVIHTMIPKKTFEIGSLESFEKFITIQTLRKKTLALIVNIIDNDLLNDDLLEPITNIIDTIEADNLKKVIGFYSFVSGTLVEYNCLMLTLEICFSKDLKLLSSSEQYAILYQNVLAGKQLVESLIVMIKNDSFSISFQHNCEKLKTIVNIMKEQLSTINQQTDDPLLLYYRNMLIYISKMIKAFRIDRIQLMLNDNSQSANKIIEVSKIVMNGFKNLKKVLGNINDKFFMKISYDYSKDIFDTDLSYYTRLVKTIEEEEYEVPIDPNQSCSVFISKYEKLIESSNQLCVAINSSIEKFEKTNAATLLKFQEEQQESTSLPISQWNTIAKELTDELESIAKTRSDLEHSLEIVKEAKLETAQLQSRYDELSRSKQENDCTLAELMVKTGKIDQLETSNEEYKKKIDKYICAMEDLSQKGEKNRIELAKLRSQLNSHSHNMNLSANSKESKNKRMGLGLPYDNTTSVITLSTTIDVSNMMKKDRRALKSKLMKEKLSNLINDNNSYMNKYISTDLTINKDETKVEVLETIKDDLLSLNKGYDNLRANLTVPTILDISSRGYNFKKNKSIIENQIKNVRTSLMKYANKIFYEMFGDKMIPIFTNDQLDHDISKTLKGFEENKVSVGMIRIQELKEKSAKDKEVKGSSSVIPLFLSEEALKTLNRTFIH